MSSLYNKCKKVGNLPVDFGEKEAEKSMESLNKIINDILHEDQEDSNDSDKYNESFIKSIKNTEKHESIEIKDLNQLFNNYYFNNLDDEYSYDLEVDVLYIEKKDDDYKYSIEVTSKLIIDFNSTNDIIGVEMLDVSRILKIDEEELINPKTVNIEITTQNNETYLMDMEINGQHLIIYKNSNGVYYMNNNLFNTIQSYKNIFIEFNKLNIQNALIRQKQRKLIDISINIYKTERQNLKDAILTEIHYQIYLAIKQLFTDTNLSITLSDGTIYSTSREIITNCKVAKYISQNLTKEFNNYITDIICNEEIETVPDYLEYRYTEENKQIIMLITIQFDKLFKQQYNNVDLLNPPKEIKDIQYNIKT